MARSGRKRKNKRQPTLRELSYKVRGNLMDDLELVGLEPNQRTVSRMIANDPDADPASSEAWDAAARRLVHYGMARVDTDGLYSLTTEGHELAQMMVKRLHQREQDDSVSLTAQGGQQARVDSLLSKDKFVAVEGDDGQTVHHYRGDSPKISTMSLIRFSQKAREAGYERVLSDELMDSLDLNGLHVITESHLYPHEHRAGCFFNLALKNHEPLSVWLDFAIKDADLMMSAFRTKPEQLRGQISGNLIAPMPLNRLRWAASRSFDYAWELNDFFRRAVQALILNGDFTDKNVSFATPEGPLRGWEAERLARSSRAIYGHNLMRFMPESQVVVVDPELAEPVIDHSDALTVKEASEWVKTAVFPHNPMYLDLEGPGGRPTLIKYTLGDKEIIQGIRGCVFYRDAGDHIHITPIGGDGFLHDFAQPSEKRELAILGDTLHESYGSLYLGGMEDYQRASDSRWYSLKVLDSIGRQTDISAPIWTSLSSDLCGDEVPGLVMTTQFGHFTDTDQPEPVMVTDLDEPEVAAELDPLLHVITQQAVAAINVLFFVQASNVTLVDAPIEPKLLKRNLKRGHEMRISQIVRIHAHTKRNVNAGGEGEGRKRLFDHVFKVRAHVRHYQSHTRIYQSRPDLVTPCPRCGSCRKVAVREHFRGTGEYVQKTRLVVD